MALAPSGVGEGESIGGGIPPAAALAACTRRGVAVYNIGDINESVWRNGRLISEWRESLARKRPSAVNRRRPKLWRKYRR